MVNGVSDPLEEDLQSEEVILLAHHVKLRVTIK